MRHTLMAAFVLAVCGTAQAQNITLFGQEYSITRLDYAQVLLPNIPFPMDPPVPFTESEGIIWVGNNKVLMSADDIDDVGFGMPENWIIEVEFALSPAGDITGFAGFRPIVVQAISTTGYDLNPSGITVNPGAGHGGGGNVLALQGDGLLYGFSYQAGSEGTQLEFPTGSGCLATPATCAMIFSGRNTNAEDVAYVSVRGGEFFVTNQDITGVERWNAVTGDFLGSFPVGPAGSTAKGIAYTPDSAFLPASIRRPDGVVFVAFDDDFPALQAVDVDGNVLGTELLTVDGTPGGVSRLDVTGCPSTLSLESLTVDPATGRLFLSNQGSLTLCNYIFVLTPVFGTPCEPDFNQDGNVDQDDIACLAQVVAGDASCSAIDPDFNRDGNVDQDDIAALEQVVGGQPCP
ncbi:MAG: hypothetical protein SFY69_05255 [Planctomycetota bacterium]|nr:hypothetical protein [Planctomycetota bacterium]